MTKASEQMKDRWATLPVATPDGGKVVVHTGRYVERSAPCPSHQKLSHDFEGVTSSGWLFRCKAKDGTVHLFVADPAGQSARHED